MPVSNRSTSLSQISVHFQEQQRYTFETSNGGRGRALRDDVAKRGEDQVVANVRLERRAHLHDGDPRGAEDGEGGRLSQLHVAVGRVLSTFNFSTHRPPADPEGTQSGEDETFFGCPPGFCPSWS